MLVGPKNQLRLFLIPFAVCGIVGLLALWASDPVEALIRSNQSEWQDKDMALLEMAKLSRLYAVENRWRKCPVDEFDPNAREALRRQCLRDPNHFISLASTSNPVHRAAILLTLAEIKPDGSKAVLAEAATKDPDPWIRRTLAARKGG